MNAMEGAMVGYLEGRNGFPKDKKKGFHWAQKAHEAGSVFGLAELGQLLAVGSGVARNQAEGAMYLGIAAEKGSNFACYCLGSYILDGSHGFGADKAKAALWLEKSLDTDCKHRNMGEALIADAKQKLDGIKNGNH